MMKVSQIKYRLRNLRRLSLPRAQEVSAISSVWGDICYLVLTRTKCDLTNATFNRTFPHGEEAQRYSLRDLKQKHPRKLEELLKHTTEAELIKQKHISTPITFKDEEGS